MSTKKMTILMVDDDAEDRMLLHDAFTELGQGHCLQFATNGEEALRHLEQSVKEDALPCLVILDLNMPRLNGRQTLAQMKKTPHLEHLTVVIYSTSLNPFEKGECLSLGANDYIVKPITHKESLDIARRFYAMVEVEKSCGW